MESIPLRGMCRHRVGIADISVRTMNECWSGGPHARTRSHEHRHVPARRREWLCPIPHYTTNRLHIDQKPPMACGLRTIPTRREGLA